ncbi:MAG: L-threonylcarbamoyladenylate synthase [Patescibacteria group bacterium]
MNILKMEELDINFIVDSLKNGKTLVYPTETCYGLGADALNEKAVEKIFKIKQRQENKSLLILVSDLSMIIDKIDWNEKLNYLAEKYWPGPLTLVATVKKDIFPRGVVSEDDTIAFRVSSHPLTIDLCQKLGGPIISTSANLSSTQNPYSIKEIEDMFANKVDQPDLIIDAGELVSHSPSTIASVQDGKIKILRQGELFIEEL